MFDLLKIHQSEAAKSKSILFPNSKVEIEKEYLTLTGLKDICEFEIPSALLNICLSAGISSEKYFYVESVLNNIIIGSFVSSNNLFSLWTKSKLKKVLFYPNDKFPMNQFNMDNDIKDIDSLLENTDSIIMELDYINGYKISSLCPEFNNKLFWVTLEKSIQPELDSIDSLICSLGLDHFCEHTNWNSKMFGVTLEINDLIYKPNVTNNPSEIAYCCLPKPEHSEWGSTIHLITSDQAHPESVVPFKYFCDRSLKVIRLKEYEKNNDINFDPEKTILNIHQKLGYKNLDLFDFQKTIDNKGNFNIKFIKK